MKLRQATVAALAAARNVLVGGNLASLTLVTKPRAMLQYVSYSLFSYKSLSGRRGIPQRNVFEVLPRADTEAITLAGLTSGDTWFYPEASYAVDIVSLCLLCRLTKPSVVFEIGTLRGYTAYHFALNTPKDALVFTLDLPRDSVRSPSLPTTVMDDHHIRLHAQAERYCFEGSEIAHKITCLHGDSAVFDFSPYFGRVGLFFIDGAHSYEYVRADTLNALRCCHAGSVIAWHDFGRVGVNGVTRWLRELVRTKPVYSVPGGSLAFMVVE